jgi:Zn-dependent M28 family amino/carboxypeptidase
MKKKMIAAALLLLLGIAALLAYPVLRIRWTPSVPPSPAAGQEEIGRLRAHVDALSVRIGPRSVLDDQNIESARRYIDAELRTLGYEPVLQSYDYRGRKYGNVIVTIPGQKMPRETILVGAHYDTVDGTPGADDNASGVAALLELCRMLKDSAPARTLKMVFFTLEEPPVFRTESMGSAVCAREAKAVGERISAMISLEMLGYYNDRPGGQAFPLPLMGLMFSTTPNFIAVVGNLASGDLVRRIAGSLTRGCDIPVETLATVGIVPGVDFSDHRSFWEIGCPAVMITDTAFYRNPNYHSEGDTISTLDFNRMARLLRGLVKAVEELCNA